MKKKGQLNILTGVVLSLVVIGFLLVIGLTLLGQTKTTIGTISGTSSAEYNAAGSVISAVDDIPGWLPVIVLAFIALIVLSVVFMLNKRM